MPKAKNAPLEKAAPRDDAMTAATYFSYGDIGFQPIVAVRDLQLASLAVIEKLKSSAERTRWRSRHSGNLAPILCRDIFSLAKDIHEGNSKPLRAMADAIDFLRASPRGNMDPLRYFLCVIYASEFANLAYATGKPSPGGFPFDPGPGLRPSFRAVFARMREVPALKRFFAEKLNPERQIRTIAKSLGMKFGGNAGRPRKP
jgi:hypothetical protein